jgi:capsule polysaccharide modification protein KpsS
LRGVRVLVFEEGYLRPDFITLEEDGVNGNSGMPTDPETFRRALHDLGPEPPTEVVGPPFSRMAWYATFYALALTHLGSGYPHYAHHRPLNAWWHTYIWCRSVWIKYRRRWQQRHVLETLTGDLSKRYFFLPLQVHSDAQVHHSTFASVEAFVVHAVEMFARYAEPSIHLVVKHHPLDRPFCDYSELLGRLAREHGLGDRIVYVDDLHLPTILDHALGTVTMNSTVGLTSLERGIPVKLLGRAIYDVDGLVFGGSLEAFFRAPGQVDEELVRGFRVWLRHHNQANGNFARRLASIPRGSGVRWPAGLFVRPTMDRAETIEGGGLAVR